MLHDPLISNIYFPPTLCTPYSYSRSGYGISTASDADLRCSGERKRDPGWVALRKQCLTSPHQLTCLTSAPTSSRASHGHGYRADPAHINLAFLRNP
eukprot:gene7565-biopygen7563